MPLAVGQRAFLGREPKSWLFTRRSQGAPASVRCGTDMAYIRHSTTSGGAARARALAAARAYLAQLTVEAAVVIPVEIEGSVNSLEELALDEPWIGCRQPHHARVVLHPLVERRAARTSCVSPS